MTRENTLVWLPLIVAWVASLRTGRRLRTALAVLAGAAVVIGPVAVRNRLIGGEWHLTTAQFGPNLYIGNSDAANGTYVPLRAGHGNATYERADAIAVAQAAVGTHLTAAQVSDYWRDKAIDWMKAHPGQWMRLTARKFLLLANSHEAADTEDIASYAEWSWPLRMTNSVVTFGLLAPLAILGVWVTRTQWRTLWLLHALVISYAVSVAFFYVLDRYRYPLVFPLCLFAGAAVGSIPKWWSESQLKDRVALVLLGGACAVLCNWPQPLLATERMKAATAYNVGVAMASAGRIDDAILQYERAEYFLPSFADARSNLGVLLAQKGDHDAALAQYLEALRLKPDLPEALNNVGLEMASRQRFGDAIDYFRRALTLEPDNPEPHYNLGTALAASGQTSPALEEFREAIRLNPTNAAAHNNLGIVLASLGQVQTAVAEFQEALRLQPEYPEAQANLDQAQALLRSSHQRDARR